jgi:hypothetical protein
MGRIHPIAAVSYQNVFDVNVKSYLFSNCHLLVGVFKMSFLEIDPLIKARAAREFEEWKKGLTWFKCPNCGMRYSNSECCGTKITHCLGCKVKLEVEV